MDPGEEFWFAGADPDKQVHGFIMKPHGYEKGKKYGMVFLVHGKSRLRQSHNYELYDLMQNFQ